MARSLNYRDDIQGLRAVAALLVACYHIWFGRVSGGVDVFFVVSSFLIIRSLVGQLERTGHIEFAAFWAGLSKRLLPAALLVLLVVVAASALLMPKIRWAVTIKEVAASALYVENWVLALASIDYLSRGNALSPVQHYWALSIQGQFYVLIPLALAGVAMLAARLQKSNRSMVAALLAAVFVASLAYSIVRTATDQAFAYFDTFARLWEFAIGGALALMHGRVSLPVQLRLASGWLGLAAIVSCGMVLSVSTVFPGYAALWPTLGAALVILGGGSGSRFGADQLLSSRPLIYLGNISYAIYLWHWPLFVFYRLSTDSTEIGLLPGVVLIGLSIGLADLTTRFVESPLRFTSLRPSRTLMIAGSAVAVMLAVTAAWGATYVQAKRFDNRKVSLDDPSYPGAVALEPGFSFRGKIDSPPYPGPLAIRGDVPDIYPDKCHQLPEETEPRYCEYGRKDANRTIAIVGGSHSAQWLPTLQVIAERQGFRIMSFTKASCRFSTGPMYRYWKPYPECEEWNRRIIRELLQLRPDAVFTTATEFGRIQTDEVVPGGFMEQWNKLRAGDIRVVAIRDTPWPMIESAECVELRGAEHPSCSRLRREVQAVDSPMSRLGEIPANVRFIDLSRYFCDDVTCPPVIGNIIVYRDGNHVSATYARTLAPMLERELARVISDVVKVSAPSESRP